MIFYQFLPPLKHHETLTPNNENKYYNEKRLIYHKDKPTAFLYDWMSPLSPRAP